MEDTTVFIPVRIDEASGKLLSDYAYYCDDKICMNEMPFRFEDWQIANFDMADI